LIKIKSRIKRKISYSFGLPIDQEARIFLWLSGIDGA